MRTLSRSGSERCPSEPLDLRSAGSSHTGRSLLIMSTLDNAGRQRKVRSGRRATKQRVQRDVVQAPPLQVPVPDRAVQHGWESASDAEIALRQFDMDPKYGPCIGLTRQQRWQRAKDFGLDPPQLILDILKSPDHNVPSHSLWEHTASGSGPVIE